MEHTFHKICEDAAREEAVDDAIMDAITRDLSAPAVDGG
jgi:hypothetical protein